MADKPKDNAPESVKKYESLKKKAKRILDTTKLSHSEAFVIAAEPWLRDKEGYIHGLAKPGTPINCSGGK